MTKQATVTNIANFNADRLGQLRAEIKALQDEAKAIENLLKTQGPGRHEGHDFVANVIEAERTTVDWKKVACKLHPSTQLITAHTKHTTVVSVKVTGHAK